MYLNDLKEGDTVTMTVKRDGETRTITYTPDVSVRYLLGFNRSDASSMTVESLIDGMPLQEAGLQAGDTITAINGTEIADGEAYDAYLDFLIGRGYAIGIITALSDIKGVRRLREHGSMNRPVAVAPTVF